MCRNIRPLYNFEPPVTADEIVAAARQFVRKVSGYQRPSKANGAAFELAVSEVATATSRLLASLVTTSPPKNREEEARKRAVARARRTQPGATDTSAGTPAR